MRASSSASACCAAACVECGGACSELEAAEHGLKQVGDGLRLRQVQNVPLHPAFSATTGGTGCGHIQAASSTHPLGVSRSLLVLARPRLLWPCRSCRSVCGLLCGQLGHLGLLLCELGRLRVRLSGGGLPAATHSQHSQRWVLGRLPHRVSREPCLPTISTRRISRGLASPTCPFPYVHHTPNTSNRFVHCMPRSSSPPAGIPLEQQAPTFLANLSGSISSLPATPAADPAAAAPSALPFALPPSAPPPCCCLPSFFFFLASFLGGATQPSAAGHSGYAPGGRWDEGGAGLLRTLAGRSAEVPPTGHPLPPTNAVCSGHCNT